MCNRRGRRSRTEAEDDGRGAMSQGCSLRRRRAPVATSPVDRAGISAPVVPRRARNSAFHEGGGVLAKGCAYCTSPRTSGSTPEPHPAVPHPCAVSMTGTTRSADEGEAKHDDQSTNALEHADSLKRDEEGVDTPPGPRHVTTLSLDQSVERPPARKTAPEHRGRLEGTVRRSIPQLGLQLVAELLNIPSRTNQFQPPAEEEAGHPGRQRSDRAAGNAAGNHLVDTGPCPITNQSSRLSPPPPPQIHQRLPAPGHATPLARPRSI